MSKPRKPPTQPRRKTTVENTLAQAIALHRNGQTEQAMRHYRAILQARPTDPDALHYLGVAQHQLGQHDEAIRLIGCALRYAPGYTDARNNLGNVQKEAGRFADAESSYRAVLAERPGFLAAHNNLGVVLREQGRHAEAIAAYRAALELAPDFAPGWVNLGHALKQSGDRPEALTAYYRAVMLQTTDINAYRRLGTTLVAFQRYDEALNVYRLWKKVQPDNPVVDHMIAACHGAATPQRASDSYIQHTFDSFAESFDNVLTQLDYRAPALCGDMTAALLGQPSRALDVLDAGCGTGLCAPYLRPYARRLDGVDLSPGMLTKARLRNVYDQLHAAELTTYLSAHDGVWDLVVSADTLCYFGAIDPLMAATAGALRVGGHVIFTVELTTDAAAPTFQLHPHGRYSHSEQYVRQALELAGLELVEVRQVTLRQESDMPVIGLLVGARKPNAKS